MDDSDKRFQLSYGVVIASSGKLEYESDDEEWGKQDRIKARGMMP